MRESNDQGACRSIKDVGVACTSSSARSLARCAYDYCATADSDRPAKSAARRREGISEGGDQRACCSIEDVSLARTCGLALRAHDDRVAADGDREAKLPAALRLGARESSDQGASRGIKDVRSTCIYKSSYSLMCSAHHHSGSAYRH